MNPTYADHAVLIVPGLRDSGPAHWQTLWERDHPQYQRVLQRNWEHPDLDEWVQAVDAKIRESRRPVILVAHGFGCLAVARRVGRDLSRVRGALLVAPADPDRFNVKALLPQTPFVFPSTLVASSSDLSLTLAQAQVFAGKRGSRFVNLGDAGHINAESGFGPWPYGEHLLHKLIAAAGIVNQPEPRSNALTADQVKAIVAPEAAPLCGTRDDQRANWRSTC